MGLGATFGALLWGPWQQVVFSGVGHSGLLGMLIYHIERFTSSLQRVTKFSFGPGPILVFLWAQSKDFFFLPVAIVNSV